MTRALLVLACLLAPHVARADDCPGGVMVGGVCVVPAGPCVEERIVIGGRPFTKDGQPAPWCDGVLPPPAEYARLQQADDRADEAERRLSAEVKGRAADNAEHARVEARKDKQIADCERSKTPTCPSPPQRMSAWEGGLIGAAITIVVTGAVVAAVALSQ